MVAEVAGKRPLGAMGRAGLVVGMHAAALFVIAQGLVLKDKKSEPDRVIAEVYREVAPVDPVPQVVPREYDPTIRFEAPVEVPIDPEPQADGLTAEAIPDGPIVTPPRGGSAEAVPNIVGVRPLARGLTQPPYPAVPRGRGVEGTTELEVYVLPSGRVGDARIVKSAGVEAFDRAAMEEARRNWRFAPATRDGVPFAQWYRLRVVFKLENER